MPIRPENKHRYPANWLTEVRPRILNRASNEHGWPCCEECKVPNYAIGYRCPDGIWHDTPTSELGEELHEFNERGAIFRVIKIVLTIAHLSDQIEDCSDENLRAWCQRCHNRYDRPRRRAGMVARNRAKKAMGDLFACG